MCMILVGINKPVTFASSKNFLVIPKKLLPQIPADCTWENFEMGKIGKCEFLAYSPIFTLQWFRLTHLPTFYPSKTFPHNSNL